VKRIAMLVVPAVVITASPVRAEGGPWDTRISAGLRECAQVYAGADLKNCRAQVRQIVGTMRHWPKTVPARYIQPNAVFGLPWRQP
jgi:hypothetical protein